MRRITAYIALGASMISAAVIFAQIVPAQQLERGLRPHAGDQKHFSAGGPSSVWHEIRMFHLNGVQYRAGLLDTALFTEPDWAPSQPLPLDFSRVEAIARQQLRRFVADDSTWEVKGFHLRSARVSSLEPAMLAAVGGNSSPKWYFQVEMEPTAQFHSVAAGQQPDSFWVFIDLSGRAGIIESK